VIDAYGVDALRWYLFASAPPGSSRRFSLGLVSESLRKFMLTLWNTYSFFVTYASLDGWTPDQETRRQGDEETKSDSGASAADSLALIDRWALASLNGLVRDVTKNFEAYEVYPAARAIEQFVDELSNWYVRRNRRRFWKSEADADKQAAYSTLYTCLLTVSKLVAPFTPFVAEVLYRNLTGQTVDGGRQTVDGEVAESVHLARWPQVDEALLDEQLVADTEALLGAVSLGRAARKHAGLKVRQPLAELWVRASNPAATEGVRRFESDLRDELNVKSVRYLEASSEIVEYRFKPNLRAVGKKYGKLVPALTTALKALVGDEARAAAHAVEAGRPVALTVDGQALELLADELLVESSAPEGYAVAEGNGMIVALNTAITPELRLEGAARDLVRSVQDARKRAGLAISDRIALYLASDSEGELLAQTLAVYGDYLRGETLATSLAVGVAPEGAYSESVELGDGEVMVGVARV